MMQRAPLRRRLPLLVASGLLPVVPLSAGGSRGRGVARLRPKPVDRSLLASAARSLPARETPAR